MCVFTLIFSLYWNAPSRCTYLFKAQPKRYSSHKFFLNPLSSSFEHLLRFADSPMIELILCQMTWSIRL